MKPNNQSKQKLLVRVTCIVLVALMIMGAAYLTIAGILTLLP